MRIASCSATAWTADEKCSGPSPGLAQDRRDGSGTMTKMGFTPKNSHTATAPQHPQSPDGLAPKVIAAFAMRATTSARSPETGQDQRYTPDRTYRAPTAPASEKGRQPEADVRSRRSNEAAGFEACVGGALHGGRPW